MADNVDITAGSGTTIATDQIGSVHYQKIKIAFGAADSATLVDGSNGFPVEVLNASLAITAASLPLPTGAATAAKQPALGTAGTASADVLTVQGIASMTPLLVDGSGVVQPVSGTVAATQSGAWSVRAQDGGGNALTSLSVGSQRALTIAVVDASGNQITSFGGSGGTASNFGSAVPSAGTAAGYSDGANMQAARVFDLDTGAGTQYVLGVGLRLASSGGSVEAGTAANPIRVDPTGATTQPVSGTVAATQSGAWNIGTVTTCATVTSLTQLNGNTIATNTGNASAGTLRVVLATDQPALSNAQPVKLSPQTSGGLTISRTISAASTNGTNVKSSAGQIYGWYLSNTNASVRYLKLYDKATTPTVGTDTPVMTIAIPPGGGANVEYSMGVPFVNGIGIGITTGATDADTGAVAANEIIVNLLYK